MKSELDPIVEDLGKLKRYLGREKYVDEAVYEVFPKDLASELAARWAAVVKSDAISTNLDREKLAQVSQNFRALKQFSNRQVMRSRYDDEIKDILGLIGRSRTSPSTTAKPPVQPIGVGSLAPKPGCVMRRVFISMPADEGLPEGINEIKWGIIRKIAEAGYEPQIFVGCKWTAKVYLP